MTGNNLRILFKNFTITGISSFPGTESFRDWITSDTSLKLAGFDTNCKPWKHGNICADLLYY